MDFNTLLLQKVPFDKKYKLGHCMRFSFSDVLKRDKILSMEMQSVYKDKQPFSKAMKRLIDNKNRSIHLQSRGRSDMLSSGLSVQFAREIDPS